MGCSCRSFTIKDLEEDEEVAAKISQNLARNRESQALADDGDDTDTENASTDDEVNPYDDTQSQEIL